MTKQERLEYLLRIKKDLWEKVHDQDKKVTDKLWEILNRLNEGNPLPIRPLRENEIVHLDPYSTSLRDRNISRWSLSKDIEFVAFREEDLKKKWAYDFGSSFSLYIKSNRISLNHGSCGEWGAEELGQLSRLKLMTSIFEHEKEIIDELDKIIDPQIIRDYISACSDYDILEREIDCEKREAEKKAILESIKPGMYLVYIGTHWADDNGVPKQVPHYYGWEKINKITDKNFLTEDRYGYNYRRPIETILSPLKYHNRFLVEDPEAPVSEEHLKQLEER